MTAYLVVFARIKDRARFLEDYAKPAAALVAAMGGAYIVRSPKTTALEGDWGDGWSIVISRWPDRAAIDRFWGSPDYERLKAIRAPLGEFRVMIVEDL